MKTVTINYQDFIDFLSDHDLWATFLNSYFGYIADEGMPEMIKIEGGEEKFMEFVGAFELNDGSWEEV